MFPSRQLKRPHEPITDKTVWHACQLSARRAGITKPIHPHTLRHYAASRTMPRVSMQAVIDGPLDFGYAA
jgi:site-specific recombinase XerD